MAADLYEFGVPKRTYWDRRLYSSCEEYLEKLANSSTVYVGNLSFYTSEVQLYELFRVCGRLQRVIMGLDRLRKTPCGFCFIEYEDHAGALSATSYISGTKLDDRIIRVELDAGFTEGRQYGRGRSGGQVRDERRLDYDSGRGGYGKMIQQQLAAGDGAHHIGRKRRFQGGHDSGEKRARAEEPAGNQTMQESNPRFRGDRDGSDDEDEA